MGPAKVGHDQSIGLTPSGAAESSCHGPRRRAACIRARWRGSTRTRCRGSRTSTSCSSPARRARLPIPNGGTIGEGHTYSFVSLDQVFDSLDPLTRPGCAGVIQRRGREHRRARRAQANQTLEYLAPGLASTSNVTAELDPQRAGFRRLLVQGGAGDAGAGVAQRGADPADREHQHDDRRDRPPEPGARAGAVAAPGHADAVDEDVRRPADDARRARSTGRSVEDGRPPAAEFASKLDTLTKASIPTVGELSDLIHNPAGTGDLTSSLLETPALARIAGTAFPNLVQAMNDSQTQLDYLREYTPDVVAALDEPRPGRRLLRRQRPLRPHPADVLRVRHRRSQPAHARSPRRTATRACSGPRSAVPAAPSSPRPTARRPNQVPGCQPGSTPPGP